MNQRQNALEDFVRVARHELAQGLNCSETNIRMALQRVDAAGEADAAERITRFAEQAKRQGMTGGEIGELLNTLRDQLQRETATVGDAITISSFLLWTFLMDQERHGNAKAAEAFAYLAKHMPSEARHMGLQIVPGGRA